MTTIARRIRSTPVRTSSATWESIVELASAHDPSMRSTFDAIANIAAMLIAEENAEASPIIVSGCGPQARFYTVHGQAAIDAINVQESALQLQASTSWTVALPATGVDFELAKNALAGIDRVSVYDPSDEDSDRSASSSVKQSVRLVTVDLSVLEQ